MRNWKPSRGIVPPGSNGIMAVPHFNGRVSPFEAALKGAFIGFDDNTGPVTSIGRCWRLALTSSRTGWRPPRLAPDLHLSTVVNVGGGAQNALWNQIKADVTGLTLRTAQAEVNAARGAALAAGIATGTVDLGTNDWFAPAYLGAQMFSPDGDSERRYAAWSASYGIPVEQLLPVFRELQSLRHPTRETSMTLRMEQTDRSRDRRARPQPARDPPGRTD